MCVNYFQEYILCASACFVNRYISFIIALLIGLSHANGDMFRLQSESPLNGFLMPMFDSEGKKIWQCNGEKVLYMNNNTAQIDKMKIEWFSPTSSANVEMVIRSDDATVSLQTHLAEGKSLITVTNVGYTILGEDWTWEGKKSGKNFSRLALRKNAHVMFFD